MLNKLKSKCYLYRICFVWSQFESHSSKYSLNKYYLQHILPFTFKVDQVYQTMALKKYRLDCAANKNKLFTNGHLHGLTLSSPSFDEHITAASSKQTIWQCCTSEMFCLYINSSQNNPVETKLQHSVYNVSNGIGNTAEEKLFNVFAPKCPMFSFLTKHTNATNHICIHKFLSPAQRSISPFR